MGNGYCASDRGAIHSSVVIGCANDLGDHGCLDLCDLGGRLRARLTLYILLIESPTGVNTWKFLPLLENRWSCIFAFGGTLVVDSTRKKVNFRLFNDLAGYYYWSFIDLLVLWSETC